jgi:cell division protein FtsQ
VQPMTASRPMQAAPRRDPAPSRTAYRMQRLWLSPLYRSLLRIGLPMLAAFSTGAVYLSDPGNRQGLVDKAGEIRRSIEERPEFMVKLMVIEGASPVVDTAIREFLPIDFPVSSFDLDLDMMQEEIAALDVIESASLRIRPGGVLEIRLKERVPAVVWRSSSGLELLDAGGHRIASVSARAVRGDLPLVAGQGASDEMAEALAIIRAAAPLTERMRGLVRVGKRRWDVVLTRDQRILLPEKNPVAALEQVIALDKAQDLLSRDVTVIDMRNPARPTLRIAQRAVEELRRIRGLEMGEL